MRLLLHTFFPIFFSLILLFQTGLNVIVAIKFEVNKELIAATLCENKNKPEMKCEGKCYLRKQLKEVSQEQHDKAPNSRNQIKLEIDLFSENFNNATNTSAHQLLKVRPLYSKQFLGAQYSIGVFSPPWLG